MLEFWISRKVKQMLKTDFFCTNCGDCCGPVPITKQEFNQIKRYVKDFSLAKFYRLKTQTNNPLECIFRDKATNTCSIYPVRPDICKMFGFYEGMICPNNKEYRVKSKDEGHRRINKNRSKSEMKGIISIDISLSDFLK